jgi:hypothetical protein
LHDELLDDKLIWSAALEARRAEIVVEVAKAVETPISSAASACSTCSPVMVAYVKELRLRELWPPVEVLQLKSISGFLDRMAAIKEPARTSCPTYYCSMYGESYSFRVAMRDGRDGILGKRVGLCLDCVKTGRDSFYRSECRIKHS